VYGAYKASKTPSRPSFEEVYSSYQAGRGNARQQQINNSYAALGVSSTAQAAIEDYRKRIEGYDWITEGDYYYDAFSETDQARKAAGEIPEYLYKKYDFKDPDDVALYGLGLPPKSIIRSVANKADKAKADKQEEAEYEQYRAQIAEAEKAPFEKLVGGVKTAIDKGATLQAETAPKATAQPAEDVPMYNGVPLYDAVFGDGQPAQPAAQDWRQQIVGAFDKAANLSAAEVAAMHERQTQAKTWPRSWIPASMTHTFAANWTSFPPKGLPLMTQKSRLRHTRKAPFMARTTASLPMTSGQPMPASTNRRA
jgi:hypothetical protein